MLEPVALTVTAVPAAIAPPLFVAELPSILALSIATVADDAIAPPFPVTDPSAVPALA